MKAVQKAMLYYLSTRIGKKNSAWVLLSMRTILRRKKDGDWYIYPQFVAHENFKNVHKKAQKGCKIFKPTIHNVLSTGTNIVKIWLSLCLIGSQGIVVKCTAAIFFPTVDCEGLYTY